MTIPLKALGGQLKGRIVWVGSHGLGIEFQTPETGRKALPEEGCTSEREYREMGKIKGRKVRWEPSSTPDVTYRLYWSIGGGVDYHSDHVDVGNATEIVLPNDIPSFPMASDRFELGISAINQAGNESELIKAVVHVDFTVPDAPKNLMVEDI